jgi:RNA polymerase-interacting CarD/CdnL/TRCF family regulator
MADGNGIVDGNGSAASKQEIKTFETGDLVVYPNHGAGTVSGVEEKTILGEERRYYIVYVPDGGLTLNIPADGDSGLRSCAGDKEVAGALKILRGGPEDMPAHWNHRLKHNQEKLRSGEISRVALGKSLEIDEAEALVDGALRGDGKA